MRYIIVLLPLLIFCPDLAKAKCGDQNRDVASAVRALTAEKSHAELIRLFDVFMAHPQAAACRLVNELKVVKVRVIKPDEVTRYWTAMHVIWSLRALRYITSCQDFQAGTNEHFDFSGTSDLDTRVRTHFLTREGPGIIPFFSVWMSRDIVVVAAADAQSSIIRAWQTWLFHDRDFDFKSCQDLDGWYF